MKSSVSRNSNCCGNAPTETLCGRSKVGRLKDRRFAAWREAVNEVIDWLNLYNNKRLHPMLVCQPSDALAMLHFSLAARKDGRITGA